ncbi:MAG: hypothetical protein ACJ741_04975 [Pyrinomonadaceae bacterium]
MTPLRRRAAVLAGGPRPGGATLDIARLSPAELETLALDVLTKLNEQGGGAAHRGVGGAKSSWGRLGNDDPQQIHLGMENVRRLLPLAKKLTLETLRHSRSVSKMDGIRRSVAAVRRIVLDPRLGGAAEVREEDLSIIHIGPDYAAYLTSDDEAMLLLGHELTHVSARTGGLTHLIENVGARARRSTNLKLDDIQREELACDFTGAEVLKRYIALHPTDQTSAERFSRAFGYEPPTERLARAWQDFCASYNGDAPDKDHLSQDQTLRALPGLDHELNALIPDDATSARLCR